MTAVAEHQGVTHNTLAAWRDRYLDAGLSSLEDKPHPGRPPLISGEQRAKVTALACSEAPASHARWDLRLLAEKVVELEYCETIPTNSVPSMCTCLRQKPLPYTGILPESVATEICPYCKFGPLSDIA